MLDGPAPASGSSPVLSYVMSLPTTPDDLIVDVETETPEQRAERFERDAMPFLDQPTALRCA